MKVVMLYRPKSEFARSAEQFVREFERRTAKTIEKMDIDSPRGIELAQLYGVMSHPAFVATADDGNFLKMWDGHPLPLFDQLSAYADVKR